MPTLGKRSISNNDDEEEEEGKEKEEDDGEEKTLHMFSGEELEGDRASGPRAVVDDLVGGRPHLHVILGSEDEGTGGFGLGPPPTCRSAAHVELT